ncbi:Eukaryotic peptide chain release factor GTP-binding subunit ERF3A [Clonorchis sinensis]|uniref:Eukaryotic peptide chain release factor GTP-binding subunit ERF3A n=1 Tax=Clonorchis sinensis TaxID=79923 RepID=A0A8T1MES2_CLOSI|nr:Eukaryotic peptide chain release factor GTP-binding subunit ERF3A [Clonorchis sinensis]
MNSWEEQLKVDSSVVSSFSNLDINAPEFIPGQPYVIHPKAAQPPVTTSDEDLVPEYPVSGDTVEDPGERRDVPAPDDEVLPCDELSRVPELPSTRKDTINLVFIGHVDAGKSTIGGHLLYLTDMVDKRTLEKYEREAKEKNRETWYLSWALDTNPEERDKGKTVECGRAYFETEKKRFVLIDAPGHKSFVPNMISGAVVADLAILVISARRGEFETGFEKGGQTREHAVLVKTAGVKYLVVVVNKMDDPTVLWDEARYNECKEKIIPFLKKVGFNMRTEVHFMPCSGYTGAFLRDVPSESVCSWYRGPSLLEFLDSLPSISRKTDGPLRIPITDKYKDMGIFVTGKVESGTVSRGQSLVLMPSRIPVEAAQVFNGDVEVLKAEAGETCKLRLKNCEEEDISPGFCLCSPSNLCKVSDRFDAKLIVLDCKSIMCPGYTAVLHMHSTMKEVRLRTIICRIDKKTNQKTEIRPRFIKQDDAAVVRFEVIGGTICLETFESFPQMGRFTLRDEGKTVAIGKVVMIIQPSDSEA